MFELGQPVGIQSYRHGGCALSKLSARHPTRQIDDHELIIVRSGQLEMFEGDRVYHMASHEFIHLEPGINHGGAEDYSDDCSFFWFHFDGDDKILAELPKTGHFRRPEIAADLATRLLDEQDRNDAPEGSCLLLMNLLLLECTSVQNIQQQDPSGLVDQAQSYIRRHFLEPISTRDVAEHCNCHPDHLGRLFQARLQISVSQQIREQRLRRARSLLRDSKMSISEIAKASGFSEAHYFRRCFKAACGCSPANWRSMHTRRFMN